MSDKCYKDFDDLEMDDKNFTEYEAFVGPRSIKEEELSIIKNRLSYMRTHKPTNCWWLWFLYTIIILLIARFDAPWWGWIISVYFISWGMMMVAGFNWRLIDHDKKIEELDHMISWKQCP